MVQLPCYFLLAGTLLLSPSPALVVHHSGFGGLQKPEKVDLWGFDRFATYQNLLDRVLASPLPQSFVAQEATIVPSTSDLQSQAKQLVQEGNLYEDQKQYQKALITYQKALILHRQLSDGANEADLLRRIGTVYEKLNQFSDALKVYQQASTIYRQMGDRFQEASALVDVAAMHEGLDNYAEALTTYEQALAIRRSLGDSKGEASLINEIGSVYYQQGKLQRALEAYQQALHLSRKVGDQAGEGRTLRNLAAAYNDLGQYAQALAVHRQALAILQQQNDLSGMATTFNNLGLVHTNLGQYDQALTFYQKALPIWQQVKDQTEQGNVLLNMGFAYLKMQQYPESLKMSERALQLFRPLNDRAGEAAVLNNQGYAYNQLGQQTKAFESLQQALEIVRALGDRLGEGNTLDSLGTAYRDAKQYDKAFDYYQQALLVVRESGDRAAEALTLSNQGELFKIQNQSALAILFYKQSIRITEAIRGDLKELPVKTQGFYTQTVADRYRTLADLLLQQNRVLEAQQVLDLLKVQEVDDFLKNVRAGEQSLTVLRPEEEILKQYGALQQGAIAASKELTELEKWVRSGNTLTPAEVERKNSLVALRQQLNQQLSDFIRSEAVQTFVKQLSLTEIESRISFDTLRSAGKAMAQLNAVLFYPLVLEDRLELIITVPNAQPLRRTVIGVGRQQLNDAILQFRNNLHPSGNPKPTAQKLYKWLIQPIAKDLQESKVTTIIYAPDGQLRYIPLAALHDGQQWLIERYRINNITAKAIDDLTMRPDPQPRILAGAFGSEPKTVSVAGQSFDFSGLNFTTEEVKQVAKLLPNTHAMLGAEFTVKETTNNINDYTIVHLATHAELVPEAADQSFILFRDGVATLKDINNWTLDNVDLIVLSACKTGLGGKFGKNGEEVLGLGYQFTKRDKAKAAIASLWTVDDSGTQVLMTAFYSALSQGMSKAQALQVAQNTLITGDYSKVGANLSNRNLKHPYYWAPFILIGNGL